MYSHRFYAALTLILLAIGVGWLAINVTDAFPLGLFAAVMICGGLFCAWEGVRRRDIARTSWLVGCVLLFTGAVIALYMATLFFDLIFVAVCIGLGFWSAKRAFRLRVTLPAAARPEHPVVFWNPKSGGGKASAVNLPQAASVRGIKPIQLSPGDDLEELVRAAIADGADALAAAGGDGTQAAVAALAAEHDLPFACIPAGTRNHFALDLGVDRDDVVGALDAFVDGGERRVDLADVNGTIFVNNVSMGLYAEAVAKDGYREAKLRTILDAAPEVVGLEAPSRELVWRGPGGNVHSGAAVILVSNNSYRLGPRLGAGTRPRVDDGLLGVTILAGPHERSHGLARLRLPWRQWNAPTFVINSDAPVPVGVDGESMHVAPPLRFTIRPGVLRVRIAPQHPGASPSAAQPEGLVDALTMLWQLARGQNPSDVFAHHHPALSVPKGGQVDI